MGCRRYGTCISRLASSGHVTASGVCRSVFVLLWETMPKPVQVWESSLVIGGRLLIAVSLDLTHIKPFFDLSWWCYAVMSDRLLISLCCICSVTAVKCENNQEFSYNIRACNHTCRSLSGSDPRCGLDDMPVDGCGCPEGTHLNLEATCTPKADCFCNYYGGTTSPGPVVIDGRQWWANLKFPAFWVTGNVVDF